MRGPKVDSTPWRDAAAARGSADGQRWFDSTDRDALPREAVHPGTRPDRFPKGDLPEPSAKPVDRVRVTE